MTAAVARRFATANLAAVSIRRCFNPARRLARVLNDLECVFVRRLAASFGVTERACAHPRTPTDGQSLSDAPDRRLAIVVIGAIFRALFLTQYMMPILYSHFPVSRGTFVESDDHLVEGINHIARFLRDLPVEN
jgi:hypothetical protein